MKRKNNMMCENSGFTLIELMIIVSILAIISFMVVPNFLETIKKNKVRHAASEIAENISLARSYGIKEAVRQYLIAFDPGNDRYLFGFDTNGDSVPDGFSLGDTRSVDLSSYSPEISFGSDAPNGPAASLVCGGAIPGNGISGWGAPPVLTFGSDGSVPSLGCVFIRDQSGNNFLVSVESVVGKTNLWVWEESNVWKKVY